MVANAPVVPTGLRAQRTRLWRRPNQSGLKRRAQYFMSRSCDQRNVLLPRGKPQKPIYRVPPAGPGLLPEVLQSPPRGLTQVLATLSPVQSWQDLWLYLSFPGCTQGRVYI